MISFSLLMIYFQAADQGIHRIESCPWSGHVFEAADGEVSQGAGSQGATPKSLDRVAGSVFLLGGGFLKLSGGFPEQNLRVSFEDVTLEVSLRYW